METTINKVISFISDCEDLNQLVTILELTAHKSGVKTISEMARIEGKSANVLAMCRYNKNKTYEIR